MNFDDAQAHSEWQHKLTTSTKHAGHSLKPAEAGADNKMRTRPRDGRRRDQVRRIAGILQA
jgi:hypothetical protein